MSQDASRPPGTDALKGLTANEAAKRLLEYGPNTVREERLNPLLVFFGKFWAPVPWMLEATIALQLVFGKRDEAIIIAVLLVFNSLLSFVQEAHSNKALALLRKRLSIQARVLRDDRWQLLPAQEIVPGDAVHLRMGDISPADIRLLEGEVLLDQSALTGESLPVEVSPGGTVYAGATVKRGETTGEVTATGQRTYFGKTAELVRTAKTVSHIQQIVFTIVKYMVFLDVILAAALLIYALNMGVALEEMIPFVLSSCADIVAVGLLASKGILMAAISPVLIAELLAVVVVFLTLVDLLKVRILSGLGIR